MATYGVSYGGSRTPRSYGVGGRRSLQSLYGGARTPVQPLASAFNPISDTLSSLQAAGQQRLNAVAPPAAPQTFGGIDPNRAGGPDPYVAPSPPVSAAAKPAGAASGGSTDLSADPILTQIKALGQRGVQDAASRGLAGSKGDLINYGSVDVPQSLRDLFSTQTPATDSILGDLPGNPVLGALNDANTATAASGNPFSILAQLGQAHEGNVHGIDQATNLANLYYSSTHANQLGQENQNYLGSQNTAANNLASLLSNENAGFLSALGGAHDQYMGALPDAYARALAAGGSGATDPSSDSYGPGNPNPTPPTMTSTDASGNVIDSHVVHPTEYQAGGYIPPGPLAAKKPVSANLARLLYGR